MMQVSADTTEIDFFNNQIKRFESLDVAKSNDEFLALKHAANNGDTNAQAFVGYVLRTGRFGQEEDELQAYQLLSTATNSGSNKAKEELASLYFHNEDYAKALPLAKEAADAGTEYHKGALIAGSIYLDGLGHPADKLQGMMYLKRSSEAGNATATGFYAPALARGEGCTANPTKAAELLLKAIEKTGEAWQMYELSKIYRLTPLNDEAKAKLYLEKAASLGDADATNEINDKNRIEQWAKIKNMEIAGVGYHFFVKSGKVIDVRMEKDVRIYTTPGIGNQGPSIHSNTTLTQVIRLVDKEGIEFSVSPDSSIKIHAGETADVIYCGLNSSDSGFPACVVSKNTESTNPAYTPDRIINLLGVKKKTKGWGWGSAIFLVLSAFVPSIAFIFLPIAGTFGWMFYKNMNLNDQHKESIAKQLKIIANFRLK